MDVSLAYQPRDRRVFIQTAGDGGRLVDGVFTVHWRPTERGLLRLLKRTGWRNITQVGKHHDHLVLTASPR